MFGAPASRRNSGSEVDSRERSSLETTNPAEFYEENYPDEQSHNGSPWASPERPVPSVVGLKEENKRLTVELAQLRQSSQIERYELTRALEMSQREAEILRIENTRLQADLDQQVKHQCGADEANRILRSNILQLNEEIAALTAEIDALKQENQAVKKSEFKQGKRHNNAVLYCTALVTSFAEFASEMSNNNYQRAARILTKVSEKIAEQQFASTMGEDCKNAVEKQLAAMSVLLETARNTSEARASASSASFFQNDSSERGGSPADSAQQDGCGPNSPERRV